MLFPRCWHVTEAEKATEQAPQYLVEIQRITDISDEDRKLVKDLCESDKVVLFQLPGKNICVPTFSRDETPEGEVPFTHVMDGKVTPIFSYQINHKLYQGLD